jgi:Flp pilus assembly protein TadD
MSSNRVRAATALCAVLACAAASPAWAGWPFSSGKPKTDPASAAQTATPTSGPAQPAAAHKATAQELAMADRLEPLARAAFWAHEVDVDPTDTHAGVELAAALRTLGRYEEAQQAAAKVLILDPKNLDAYLETARAYLGADKGFYAIDPLKRAQALAPRDWRPPSLLGIALEQSKRHDEAAAAFNQALALSPDNPAVLSNLALAYAAHGDAAQAETLLRRAVAQPTATAQERQNLALVLGLEGKLGEAERLIREDLPPDTADANLAYLKADADGDHSWKALQQAERAQRTP